MLISVQTFLPYAEFEQSARVLDSKRLGKQRAEVIQIVRALIIPTYAFRSHPAVLMWKGYEEALGRYGFVVADEWVARGFSDTTAQTISTDLATIGLHSFRSQVDIAKADVLPPWLGDERLHRSHQSALLRKDPDYYANKFPEVPDDLPYYWPVRSEKVIEAEQRKVERALRSTNTR